MAPVESQEHRRRRIPLTAFALVTVPEDPMLAVYLRNREAIDISMEKRMVRADLAAGSNSGTTSDSTIAFTQRRHVDGPSSAAEDSLNGRVQASSSMELELDKFMATLTATVSPDAVIKTIASTKGHTASRGA
ncbi:uncharacterized protein Z520_07552 [Fonsecaea multimorphosa CBS 102226]|uniref:Uncharacterized protein n=1 Tax=Fonsecaea multimorphosa CBS 102226 TaxID=1442371 RepID=A0A0D2JTL6_9EURO|nr:uncharacterized protein Z520_07552 [Fonsecaea multimorphosa CBS 102226]KIX96832.1 hypothetical protein Z520_07552 [Fonsecaea multimorphosa CBS 102226]OAL22511.1 hypothetical protein AYO22_07069 [Fonsecaea multimorphosa]